MKKLKMSSAPLLLALLFGIQAFGQEKTAKKGFALLELFTSEGCSSCPPADALMGKIQKEYKDNTVYVLAYHVDYWDRLGWKDIFSNAAYTKRQYQYSNWLGEEQVYTPQVIVNGKSGHIGSQETIIKNAISAALAKPSVAEVHLDASVANHTLLVSHWVKGTSKNSRLLLAIVQKSAKSNVKRGENAHRVLSHFQIVHQLHSIAPGKEKGTTSLSLPKGFNTTDFEVVGFVQDLDNGAILGAARAIF
ncbi:DUF1223 domain-containing protein [Flavobacterium humi]|uniref:DUF1223 domain-containing protein n=1 Tax=Flavobacterium humi TaxID=2562683 RepID=A0A4Z0L4I5_9FLAO|nr:DUF1223 domain-containing protein [Flavobacterium humi]TGD56590.1 DUF1223 domain-containing protein [Flavobacterium humi]